jgi:dihydroorotate dehydrogenase electron transfer subunit
VTLCYGVRSAAYLAGVEQFRNAGVEVRLATDDGSLGQPRLVTDLLSEVLVEYPNTHVICCGPEPMMEAVARMTRQRDIECHVSLETPMACGIGICFSCVAKVGTESDWDYQRTCVEGPVFNARDIVWH